MRFESGVSLAVFFYNGPNSRAIAFEGLLNSGENFAARLKSGFKESAEPQLASVATDGESYGHHHRHGEMALAYALYLLGKDKTVKLTNFGSYPGAVSARSTSARLWKTAPGVARTGSNAGGWTAAATADGPAAIRPGAHRCGRAWMSCAMALAPLTEQEGAKLFHDVWAARDGYIQVILDRSPESVNLFFQAHQAQPLGHEERMRALQLMEMQRHAQLMYTSCGWFFDDIGGIETVQIIAYAARVLQLAKELFGEQAAAAGAVFYGRLAEARSNDETLGDGAQIYRACVKTKHLRLEQVAAHYAISSVFTPFSEETELYCFRVRRISYETYSSGRGRLALGRAHIESAITGIDDTFSFAVLHFGDQNITAAVKPYAEDRCRPI